MYERLHAVSPGNIVSAYWLRLIQCFSSPHSGSHKSCWRTACSRWSFSELGLHNCVPILPLRGPRGCGGVRAEALGKEPLKLRGGSYVAVHGSLVVTSNGLFCACSFSWSGGDRPGLHVWDLLKWMGMSGFLPLLLPCRSWGGVFQAYFLFPCLWWGFGIRYFGLMCLHFLN